jgi:hypothetical protein
MSSECETRVASVPSFAYLQQALGLKYAIVGLYDLDSIEGISSVVEKRGCLFACFEHWQNGQYVHRCRARPGCPGSAYWLCGAPVMTDEAFLDFLVETEGLKSDRCAMQQFLEKQPTYEMQGRHLLVGPLRDALFEHLRTVTIFCDPDQLSGLLSALFCLNTTESPVTLLPSFGPGCLQLVGIFPDLKASCAVISATDIAMRVHLPANLLALTVTVPLFERLCTLGSNSLFEKPFWKRLRHKRQLTD